MALRWDSPIVLSMAGTIALHLLLFVGADVMTEYAPPKKKPAPIIEIVDIEVPPIVEPPPPLPPPPEPEPEVKPPEPPPPIEQPKVARTTVREPRTVEPPPIADTPPPPDDTPPTPNGGGPVVALATADGNGPPVAIGRPNSGRIGRGGNGKGTGSGDGTGDGSGSAPPPPVSIAMLKKDALPKGDQSYLSVGKDYPPEAKQLGIEGDIRVRLVIGPDGKVTSAKLINKLGHGLDELALERAMKIEFTPAIDTNDKPVASVKVWVFHMTLPK